MTEVNPKVALVTGAGKGLGRACALGLARLGAKIAVVDIDDAAGEETVSLIRRTGGEALYIKTDVAQGTQVEAMIDQIVATWGRLDYAVNNAGIVGNGSTIAQETEENFDEVISINLKGVFLCCKYEVRQMLKQEGGAIVNMSSVMGLNGNAGSVAYAASKHGVIGITKSVALDTARNNIRVNAICPGIMQTPMVDGILERTQGTFMDYAINMTPMGRLGNPEEVADTAIWLCSEAASFVTGSAITVDGGFNAR